MNGNRPQTAGRTPGKRPLDQTGSGMVNIPLLVSEVHSALTTKQRLNVLQRICFLISSNLSSTTKLLNSGAWDALVLQMQFLLHRQGTCIEEINALCLTLDTIFCSCPISMLETIPIDNETLTLTVKASQFSSESTASVLSMWHLISASEEGASKVLKSGGLLRRLKDLLLESQDGKSKNLSKALGIIKNLTYYISGSFEILLHTPGFVSAMVEATTNNSIEAKDCERLSAIWRNVASIQENRSRLAQNPSVLQALYMLSTFHADGKRLPTVRNTLNTIVSLSMDVEVCLILLLYGDGLFAKSLEAFMGSADDTVRKRAARTVRLWSSHQSSGNLLINCSTLMSQVSAAALRDTSEEVRQEAAEAFGRVAGLVQSPMPQHIAVLDAMESLCSSSAPNVAARALKGQAAHPTNRLLLLERPVFLKTLSLIAECPESPSVARDDACTALADLAAEEDNRSKMATQEVLKALCVNTSSPTRREMAVKALVFLANEQGNIQKMVHFPGLLQSLIQFAATVDSAFKGSVKHAILVLVREL